MPEDNSDTFWFDVRDCKDSAEDIEDNINRLAGKALCVAVRSVLLADGWTDRDEFDVLDEDWGWYFILKRGDVRCLFGFHIVGAIEEDVAYYHAREWDEAGGFVEHLHRRGPVDWLLARNWRDPAIQASMNDVLRDVLARMPQVRGVRSEDGN